VPSLARLTYTIPAGALTSEFRVTCLTRFEASNISSSTGGVFAFDAQMCYATAAASFPPPPPPYEDFPYYDPPPGFAVPWDFHSDTGGLLLDESIYCGEVAEGVLAFGLRLDVQLNKTGDSTGTATLFTDATAPFDCADGSQATGALTLTPLAQSTDTDGDGCPDYKELGPAQGQGGLRDPFNRWDYFNPEKANTPHTQTIADILFVVGKYGKNQGNPLYTIDTDRTAVPGGNVWNLGPARWPADGGGHPRRGEAVQPQLLTPGVGPSHMRPRAFVATTTRSRLPRCFIQRPISSSASPPRCSGTQLL
jgi:hypothetical protein